MFVCSSTVSDWHRKYATSVIVGPRYEICQSSTATGLLSRSTRSSNIKLSARKSPWQIVIGESEAPTGVRFSNSTCITSARSIAPRGKCDDVLAAKRLRVAVLRAGGEVDRIVDARHPVEAVECGRRPPRSVEMSERVQTSARRGPRRRRTPDRSSCGGRGPRVKTVTLRIDIDVVPVQAAVRVGIC